MAQPNSRSECVSAMDAKHKEIEALQANVSAAQVELDALIQLHNRLPAEK